MNGKYLDANISLRNNGLRESEEIILKIYADNELIKEIKIDKIDVGYGRITTLKNIFVNQKNVETLEFVIDTDSEELNKDNNRMILSLRD